MKKVQFTETVLRDAGQSLIATRMAYDQFEGILETIDQAGFYSVECWGGATFDVCLRFLNEDPWEPLGTPEKDPGKDAQHQAADAAARPEHPWLQALQ